MSFRWLREKTKIHGFGVGIVVCAVAAPLTLLQASASSSAAGGADQSQLQAEALHVGYMLPALGTATQDARTFAAYAEYKADAGVLIAEARTIAASSPRAAMRFEREAQAEQSIAAGIRQAVQTSFYTLERVPPTFSFSNAVREVERSDLEVERVPGSEDRKRARAEHDRSTNYYGIATLWTIGLFFFTLAQVARSGGGAQRTFAGAGTAVVLSSVLLTMIV